MQPEPLAWVSPLKAAALAADNATHWALLYSGQRLSFTGRFSYLCLHPQESVAYPDFSRIAAKLSASRTRFDNAWFGYLGYEMLHDTERFGVSAPQFIALPVSCFTRYGIILAFDHDTSTLTAYREPDRKLPEWLYAEPLPRALSRPAVSSITSPMSRAQYLKAVEDTKAAIARGEFYQANITRKFTGSFAGKPDSFDLFRRLCDASPAAYSAYLRMGDISVLSSSPECFLTVQPGGRMETRPIKGTAARLGDAAQDQRQRERLHTSEKDRAENLMIVDLMRNDLARSCETGSILVRGLFEVTSYATLHHMSSTVIGQKRSDTPTLEAVKRCFPPGSMTGAPKIRAIEWCMQQENIRRGVYSGALGWFGGDGSCDLSVVIRTLALQNERFEFQVGGGIISDSDPESEWQETLTKARGIMKALGVDIKILENI